VLFWRREKKGKGGLSVSGTDDHRSSSLLYLIDVPVKRGDWWRSKGGREKTEKRIGRDV